MCIRDSGDTSPWDEREGPTEMGETNTENTYRDYNTDYPIQSYQQTKGAFKRQIEYDILIQDRTDKKELDELVEIATEEMCIRDSPYPGFQAWELCCVGWSISHLFVCAVCQIPIPGSGRLDVPFGQCRGGN